MLKFFGKTIDTLLPAKIFEVKETVEKEAGRSTAFKKRQKTGIQPKS